jgi:signal peptide peptidase SppA
MNIKTGLSIFKSVWLIEQQSALSCFTMWEQYMNNEAKFSNDAKDLHANAFALIKSENVTVAPTDIWSAASFNNFAGSETAIIPIDGPLMKSDFCGYHGTATMLSYFRMAEQTPSVKTIILLIDSPGGTVDGTQAFADAIAASPKNTKAVIDGMMCSAALWIGCACNEVIATSNTDIIGSIGTTIQWYDSTAYLEKNGIVLRQFNASKSIDKNKEFRDANNGNGKLLVQQYLDPTNDEFIQSVQANRAGKFNTKTEDIFTGKVYLAKDAMKFGLIDSIQPMNQALTGKASAAAINQTTANANTSLDPFMEETLDKINGIDKGELYYIERKAAYNKQLDQENEQRAKDSLAAYEKELAEKLI